ncbi:MAG TPA: RnfABCDGE type electron transport complex subunit A [Oscillospiraceae bacterium]|nr:RnfABCDGE type electron transport complex subunit A [Oscillospiraceae bacterium]HPF54915.1 RnfABCDGE type electron transport complex subunit A [Clostridiales bacterium]HPK34974.1 RnfABCDGE type electron transport complex subunit A [Oscillospiraceae bacterium]HPR75532.1 RnfABCDGE type electron transport complex subunit A [Oscillospiraceae bacterium]
MTKILAIIVAAVLTNNFVLSKFLGICPFLGVSKKLNTSVGMSAAVTFVMVLATAVTWPIQTYLLDPNGLGYMQTIVFILVIAVLVQLVEMVLKRYIPPLYSALGIYLPLITTNCAVLGVTILNIDQGYSYIEALFNAFAAGVGFLLAMVMFTGVRSKIADSDIPKSLQGLPITLVAASITALTMLGFAGLAEGLFGGM